MSHSKTLQAVRREVGMSKHIPITHLNSPTVAETQDGMIFSVMKLEGVPFQTEKNETINQFNRIWQRLLASLDEKTCLYVTVHRRKVNHHLNADFPHPMLQKINDDYMKRFQESSMYQNAIYITVLYRGLNSGKVGKGIRFLNQLSDRVIKEARQERRRAQMQDLEKIVERMQATLSTFKPTLLGSKDHETNSSELLHFLSTLVNGGEAENLPKKGIASPIASTFKKAKEAFELYPEGNIAQTLPLKRIFFGENIQFQGNTARDQRFAGMLSIKSYPEESASVALNTLMHLDCEWISTHTFAIEAKDIMMKKVKQQGNKLASVNDAGVSQITELVSLQEMIQTGNAAAGYH